MSAESLENQLVRLRCEKEELKEIIRDLLHRLSEYPTIPQLQRLRDLGVMET